MADSHDDTVSVIDSIGTGVDDGAGRALDLAAAQYLPPDQQPRALGDDNAHVDEVDVLDRRMRGLFADDAPCDDPAWCFLCTYTVTPADKARGSYYQRLLDLITEMVGVVDDAVAIVEVQDFYTQELLKYNDSLKPWSRRSIYDHVYVHAVSSRQMYMGPIRVLSQVERVASRHIIVNDPINGFGKIVDQAALRSYLNIVSTRVKLQRSLDQLVTLSK